jgi:hypothetical protein
METTWSWINGYLNEEQRKLVYDYGFIRTRPEKTIEAYLDKIGVSRSTFERRIRDYSQIVADKLNQEGRVRLTVPLDGVTEIGLEQHPSTVSSDRCERNATQLDRREAANRPCSASPTSNRTPVHPGAAQIEGQATEGEAARVGIPGADLDRLFLHVAAIALNHVKQHPFRQKGALGYRQTSDTIEGERSY